jgi:hypothetical protein
MCGPRLGTSGPTPSVVVPRFQRLQSKKMRTTEMMPWIVPRFRSRFGSQVSNSGLAPGALTPLPK